MMRTGSTSLPSPFLEYITRQSLQLPASEPREIQPPTGPENPWIRVRYKEMQLPSQGWKIHIAACEASAHEILIRTLPCLLRQQIAFKVIGSPQDLAHLNAGSAGLSQIGKFITIYPRSDEEAVKLAGELDTLTKGLPAPSIPSDRPLRPGSLVFYRYGAFQPQTTQTSWGAIQTTIQTPQDDLIADPRRSSYNPPDWAIDPFLEAGLAQELPEPDLLLANRYLLLSLAYQSVHSKIYLAVDLQKPRRCIVKRPGLGEIARGEDRLRTLIRNEARALQMLTPNPGFPTFFDLVEEQDTVFLVMQDLEGETLAQYIQRQMARGQHSPHQQIIRWGLEIASMLRTIHRQGLVYRDLKSTNLLIGEDGSLHLIDFGLVVAAESENARNNTGTPGYLSPQQIQGGKPCFQDDIYGLGAILFLIATGAEPSLAPRQQPLTRRPLHLLNPNLDPRLIQIISRCLNPDPYQRYQTIEEVEGALIALPIFPPTLAIHPLAEQELQTIDERRNHYRQLASRLLTTLSKTASPDPQGYGSCWNSKYYAGNGLQIRDINAGNSGTLLAFAELVDEFGNDSERQLLTEVARWLVESPRLAGSTLAGLYVGEAGVGTALLRAGQVLKEELWVARALAHGRWIASLPFASPDLFNGTAGRARFHLWLWKASCEQEQLEAAIAAGEELLAVAISPTPEDLYWRIPPDFGKMSNSVFLGYAHGAAGIADVLLDLYECSEQERFREAAQAAGRWLVKQAIPSPIHEHGLRWQDEEGGQTRGTFWCHGSTGIGCFFQHAATLGILPDAREIAERAALAAAHGNRAYGPVQCHGLAGNIEFLLDMYQFTQNCEYEQLAFELAILLEAFTHEEDGLLAWSADAPDIFTPDYMTGYAGIALTLLRLADPQRPRQLSLHGLNYTRL